MPKKRSRGEGSIFFNKKQEIWVAEIKKDGKAYRKYAKTQKEAREWLIQEREKLARGLLVDDQKITLGLFIDRWFEDVAKPGLRDSTINSHESIIRIHIKPTLGETRLADVTPQLLQNLCAQKLKEGLSHRTVKYIRSLLHQTLDTALEWGLVARNVADGVKTPAVKNKKIKPLTKEQVWKLLEIVKDDRLFPLYVVYLGCGLRRGEALALTWDCVDLEQGVLRITKTIQLLTGKGLVIGEPKSESSRREVSLPDFVLNALRTQHQNRNPHSPYVFCSTNGTPFYPRNILRHFKATLKKAGLPPETRIHDLRHFFISWLLAQGQPPKDVQVIAGHADFSTTMDIYGHLMPGANEEAAKRMNSLFKRRDDAE